MTLFNQIKNFFRKRSCDKPEDIVAIKLEDNKIDKVAHFNNIAPGIFTQRLQEYGYELAAVENYEHSDILWSTHHLYVNTSLNLTIDIQQAPYYTDYGFSIFIFNSTQNDPKLLCNVPHELQDTEDMFLTIISDKFFAHPDVISILKGESWKVINPIRCD